MIPTLLCLPASVASVFLPVLTYRYADGRTAAFNIFDFIDTTNLSEALNEYISRAKHISQKKLCQELIKYIEFHGLDKEISRSDSFAIKIYKECPTEEMKSYISKLNPGALYWMNGKKI